MAIALTMHPKIEALQGANQRYYEAIQNRMRVMAHLEDLPRKKRRRYARAMIETALQQEGAAYNDLLWTAEACLKVKSLSGLR